jgi:hypothetical protein
MTTQMTPTSLRELEPAEMHSNSISSIEDTVSTPYNNNVKPQTQLAREGFPKFANLPAELRTKIWGHAMPPYGIYTAFMVGHEEPMPQQPPSFHAHGLLRGVST